MITKEELLTALEDSARALDKSNEIYGLALKGLESESTVKRLIQARDLWRKKHDDLADELDDKIIALEEMLKAKDADLSEASTIINDARDTVSLKYHDEIVDSARRRITALLIERDEFQRLVGEMHTEKSCIRADLENVCKDRDALEDKLRDTVSLKYHDEIVDSANQQIISLRNERDALEDKLKAKDADLAVASKTINDALTMQILQAQLTESMASHHASVDDANRQIISLRNERNAFQRLVGELEIEKSCIRADLENVCKELGVLKDKIEELETELGSKDDDWRLSVSYYMNLAAAWEKQAKALKAKIEKCEAVLAGKELK